MNPCKHESSKQKSQDLRWKVHQGALLLFFTHTLCMTVCNRMFLYWPGFVHSQLNAQNSEQKPTTENLAGFHDHFRLLTILRLIPSRSFNPFASFKPKFVQILNLAYL